MKKFIFMAILLLPLSSFATTWWKNAKEFNFGQEKTSIYGGFQWGLSELQTDKALEAGDKNGKQYGLTIGTLLNYSPVHLNIGLNYYYLNFQSSRKNDLKFNLETKTVALEITPLFRAGSFSFGPKVHIVLLDRILVGPSDDSNENADSLTTGVELGISGFYHLPWNHKDVRLGAHFQKPVSVGPRDAQIFLLSIEVGKILN